MLPGAAPPHRWTLGAGADFVAPAHSPLRLSVDRYLFACAVPGFNDDNPLGSPSVGLPRCHYLLERDLRRALIADSNGFRGSKQPRDRSTGVD